MKQFEDKLKGGILGLVTGDALGVPFEFISRQELQEKPANNMIGYGSHNQLPGTWSDDSSMTLCTIDSLCKGYNLKDIADNFVKWRFESFWTPYGIVFGIGITTTKAIIKYHNSLHPHRSGLKDEQSNGNGSLMRILPLAFYLKDKSTDERYKIISEVSSITHAHIRSIFSCFIYVELAIELLSAKNKYKAYKNSIKTAKNHTNNIDIPLREIMIFERILDGNIQDLDEHMIQSSGYVIDSLEASIWCLLTSNNYKDSVLKAINLGGDTDTTAAITGGIAGLYYGYKSIPKQWLKKVARIDDIQGLISNFYKSLIYEKT